MKSQSRYLGPCRHTRLLIDTRGGNGTLNLAYSWRPVSTLSSPATVLPSVKHTVYCRDVLLSFGDHDDLKNPPEDLEASGIYRCAFSRPEKTAVQ